jgi:hypothetical protein
LHSLVEICVVVPAIAVVNQPIESAKTGNVLLSVVQVMMTVRLQMIATGPSSTLSVIANVSV